MSKKNRTKDLQTPWYSIWINGIWQVWHGYPGRGAGWYYNTLHRKDCWKGAQGPFKTKKAAMLAAEAVRNN